MHTQGIQVPLEGKMKCYNQPDKFPERFLTWNPTTPCVTVREKKRDSPGKTHTRQAKCEKNSDGQH